MAVYKPQNSADLAAIVTAEGDTVLFKSGVVYSAASVPAGLLSPSRITIGVIGTGEKPQINGGVERSDWTFDAVNNVYFRPAYGSNILGNVTEDGIPMKHVPWNTNIATTAAAMNAGTDGIRWAGSMTFDLVNFIVYIRPSAGVASAHKYVVSESTFGLNNSSTNTGLEINGLDIRAVSNHGIKLLQKRNLKISECDFYTIGGGRPGGNYLGNGVELSVGCWGAETTDCNFYDIFDSPVTSQLYESAAARIGHHLWKNLNVNRYGMHGVEISCQTLTHQYITDIEIKKIYSTDNGVGWSGDRNGAIVTNLTQGGTSRVLRSAASEIYGRVQKRAYMSIRTGGVNGIQNVKCSGTFGQGVRSDQLTGNYPQKDLKRNVTDNMAPVGTSWVDTTSDVMRLLSGF